MREGEHVTPQVRLIRMLGAGGMGSVWVAQHLTLKTEVAVKFILAGRENEGDARERFSREAETAAQVKSPHVAQIFDHGVTDDGIPFIVMELLEGEDLGRYLQRHGPVHVREAGTIVTQVCKALARAHAKGLVHRDVKPANIFLCDVGTSERFVKLLDFGVAKIMGTEPTSITKSGSITGTPAYMAPEQLLGNKDIDHRADLFSVAVLAYELLFGRRPIVEDNAVAIALRLHTKGMPRATEGLDDLEPDLAKPIDEWFARAWAIHPAGRYDSATQLAEDFDVLVRLLSKAQTLPLASNRASGSEAITFAQTPTGSGGHQNARPVDSGHTLASGQLPNSGPISKAITVAAPVSELAPLRGVVAGIAAGTPVQTESPLSRPPSESSLPASTKVSPDRPRVLAPWLIAGAAVLVVAVVLLKRNGPSAAALPQAPAASIAVPPPTAASSAPASATGLAVASSTVVPVASSQPTASAKKSPTPTVSAAKSAMPSSVPSMPSVKKLEDIE